MSRYVETDAVFQKLRELLYETANNNVDNLEFCDACVEIADNRLATWIGLVPTSDVVPKEKYNRLLENATILAQACNDGG